jgi:hypothetical protein
LAAASELFYRHGIHPARRVIEAFKTAQRARLVQLCAAAALAEPDIVFTALLSLAEGASAQNVLGMA